MKQTYFLAYVLKDKAQNDCEILLQELQQRYDVPALYDSCIPHITLKAPFSASREQLDELKNLLRKFTSAHRKVLFYLKGVGYFDRKVIFVNGHSSEMKTLHEQLHKMLKNLSWIEWFAFEHNYNHHVTLAKKNTEKHFENIMKLLSTKTINHQCVLDTITLLCYDGKKWVIEDEFTLQA